MAEEIITFKWLVGIGVPIVITLIGLLFRSVITRHDRLHVKHNDLDDKVDNHEKRLAEYKLEQQAKQLSLQNKMDVGFATIKGSIETLTSTVENYFKGEQK